jgi:AraC-like DNA-binding protein
MHTDGVLLDNFFDGKGRLGVVVQKGSDQLATTHQYEFPSLIFPRCHSIIKIISAIKTITSDAFSTIIVPAHQAFQLNAITTIAEWAILLPDQRLLEETTQLYNLNPGELRDLFGSMISLARTNWINEIMQRYVFERVVAGHSQNTATDFLEEELIKEIYFLSREKNIALKNHFDLDSFHYDKKSPLARKTMVFLESNLFTNVSVAAMAKALGASESTVLRCFKKELKMTPSQYVYQRRLEESLSLLKGHKGNVNEVAQMVGYSDVSAFIAAFKKRFKKTPAQFC